MSNEPLPFEEAKPEPEEETSPEVPLREETPKQEEEPKCGCEEKKEKCGCKCNSVLLVILLLGMVALFVLHFTGIGAKGNANSKVNADAKPAVATKDGLKIAYINTDTLMAKYEYAKDLEKQLKDFQAAKENSYKNQTAQFQKDYDAYIKGGADNMTLAQQQAKEKELQARLQKLQGLESEYALQIQERTIAESAKMTRAVYNFIREYNEQNQRFDIIFSRSFSNSPILYGNEGMDITDEIIKGLNEEYARVKAEQEKDKK